MTTYTTHGDVRGCCGHKHTTIESAQACLDRDGRCCRRNTTTGYTDRVVAEVGHDGYLFHPGTDRFIPGPGGRSCGAAL